jgi:hypothetical protein
MSSPAASGLAWRGFILIIQRRLACVSGTRLMPRVKWLARKRKEGMWLALTAITLAAAIGFSVFALAIQFEH